MSQLCYATHADYFRYGLEAGLLAHQDTKDWAFGLIYSLDNPPIEIIEVAMSRSLADLFTRLKQVPGERNTKLAGMWLLGLLKLRLSSEPFSYDRIVKQAIQVARSTNQDDEYDCFNAIDDRIFLAYSGTYGNLDAIIKTLGDVLDRYPVPFELPN
jgi:hypothetical protein